MQLEAWNDPRVLTGLIKAFFRRLAEPLLDASTWQPLTALLSGAAVSASPAPVLLAILVQLQKSFPNSQPDGHVEGRCAWRLATLDFLFNHLRRVAAFQAQNRCSLECIGICFGPSLFGDSAPYETKLNKILALMLQHWPWLVSHLRQERSAIFGNDCGMSSSSLDASFCRPTLAETESYAREFQEELEEEQRQHSTGIPVSITETPLQSADNHCDRHPTDCKSRASSIPHFIYPSYSYLAPSHGYNPFNLITLPPPPLFLDVLSRVREIFSQGDFRIAFSNKPTLQNTSPRQTSQFEDAPVSIPLIHILR